MNPLANDLETLRDWLRYAVSRFGEAELAFGHGTTNAYDEAAYLLLHALHLPLDRLEPFLDAKLTHAERQQSCSSCSAGSTSACRPPTSRTKRGSASSASMSTSAC